MKKSLVLLAVIGIGVATLCNSCDKRSSIVNACEQNDFAKAHQLLDKFNPETYDEIRELEKLRRLVFEKETDYLIDQNNENASKKILVLIRENLGTDIVYNSYIESSCASLMSKAIIMKNNFLIKELAKTDKFFYKESIKYLCEEDLISAKDLVLENSNEMEAIGSYSGRERLRYDDVFNASIKARNWSIAKELIDHVDNLIKTYPDSYFREECDYYLKTLKTSYSIATKNEDPENYQKLTPTQPTPKKNVSSKRRRR